MQGEDVGLRKGSLIVKCDMVERMGQLETRERRAEAEVRGERQDSRRVRVAHVPQAEIKNASSSHSGSL